MSSSNTITSPERRSAADLQRILHSLIGDAGFVLSGNLPDVLSAYERDHDLIILDPAEYDGLRSLCSIHSEMELGPKELFQFLSMVPKPSRVRSPSPTPGSSMPAPASAPPSSFPSMDHSTPKQPTMSGRRRLSDRIRSPSDSSSSSSESDVGSEYNRRRFDRETAEPSHGKPFPGASNAIATAPHRPILPKRVKTMSDPSRLDSPLAIRAARSGAGPPSAFGNSSTFARPSPASRRRRGSSGPYTSADEDNGPESGQPRFQRSTSSQSVRPSSPASSAFGSQPMSPTSPGVDNTSFHTRAKSPEDTADEDLDHAEVQVEVEHADDEDEEGMQELDETDDVVGQGLLGVGGEALNPRLSRISSESVTSLRTSHDKLQALQKNNADLSRKLKDSERQLAALGADNDQIVVDLERHLEEARHELAQKRKEDKELRGTELKHTLQISGLEADLANVQRSLEQSKEHRANMQKMYDSQCYEAQRLRELLRDRDAEIHSLEEATHEHGAEEEKYTREIQTLEADIKRLEAELVTAQRAESALEVQKHENLQLKETIDRMRFDLDEARAAVAAGGKTGSHGRASTNGSSVGGTLSRNLGDEINRRLMDAERMRETKEEEGDDDSIVETIVTTQRTRKKGSRAHASGEGGSASVPAIRIEEGIKEYADVAVLTDTVDSPSTSVAGPSSSSLVPHEHPPAYTAEPPAVNEKEVVQRTRPRAAGQDGDMEEEYNVLSQTLGIRCNVLEDELKMRKAERTKRAQDETVSRRGSHVADQRHGYSKAIVDYIVRNTQDAVGTQIGKVAMFTVAAFAIGLVAGSHMYTPGIHPRDYQLFSHMNDLARSSGAGEGFLPMGARGLASVVGAGVGMGRVPT